MVLPASCTEIFITVAEWEGNLQRGLCCQKGFSRIWSLAAALSTACTLLGASSFAGLSAGARAQAECGRTQFYPSLLASSHMSDSSYFWQGRVSCTRRRGNEWSWRRSWDFFLLQKMRGCCWERKGSPHGCHRSTSGKDRELLGRAWSNRIFF